MSSYNLSYGTIADVLACAEEAKDKGNIKEAEELSKCAEDLEQAGIGYYGGVEYVMRPSPYGLEVVSAEDLLSEQEDEDEY